MNVLLHDDWEINGDGTGDPRILMFDPARKALALCDRFGARYTLFAEVMQQFAMRDSAEAQHREWADEWEAILRDAVRRGHDVQLHLHPQWIGAKFKEGRWHLDFSKWSIAELPEEQIFQVLYRGKEYLEKLLRPVCSSYRVVAFRAGGWMAQPSGGLIRALRRAGIPADCSVVPGKKVSFQNHGEIDFRRTPSRLLPWWTDPGDVSRAGAKECGVIELPSFSEEYKVPLPLHLLKGNLRSLPHYWKIHGRRHQKELLRDYTPNLCKSIDGRQRWVDRFFASRSTYCSFGYMHHRSLMKMARAARRIAREQRIEEAPLVMLTHSKSFFSFSNFETFLKCLSKESDFHFSRTRDYVDRLVEGEIPSLPLEAGALRIANPLNEESFPLVRAVARTTSNGEGIL